MLAGGRLCVGVDGQGWVTLVVLVVAARDGDETGVVVGNDGIGKLERVLAREGADESAVDVG